VEATTRRHPLTGEPVFAYAEVGSTNDVALDLAASGRGQSLWVRAERQNAGRGRSGRAWVSPAGNLHATAALIEPCPPVIAPQLGFVAGVALHEAVAGTTGIGAPRLALKWPNDLKLDGAKCAGILLEGRRVGPAGSFVVLVGIGVDVASAPVDTPYPAAALACVAPSLTVEALFDALVVGFAAWRERWQREGFEAVRAAWLKRAVGLGLPARVRQGDGELTGLFAGLAPDGALILRTPEGERIVAAGDFEDTGTAGSRPAPAWDGPDR
jgi:BirA family biotin operon repressor/biotin-[acetyl-CoA-carboxylase] ligase